MAGASSPVSSSRNGYDIWCHALFGNIAQLQHALEEATPGSVDYVGVRGWTPLYAASTRGHVDAVRLLLSHCPQVEVCTQPAGWTPLMAAAYRGFSDIVRLLLDHGAQQGATNAEGDTVRMVALQARKSDVYHILGGDYESDISQVTLHNNISVHIGESHRAPPLEEVQSEVSVMLKEAAEYGEALRRSFTSQVSALSEELAATRARAERAEISVSDLRIEVEAVKAAATPVAVSSTPALSASGAPLTPQHANDDDRPKTLEVLFAAEALKTPTLQTTTGAMPTGTISEVASAERVNKLAIKLDQLSEELATTRARAKAAEDRARQASDMRNELDLATQRAARAESEVLAQKSEIDGLRLEVGATMSAVRNLAEKAYGDAAQTLASVQQVITPRSSSRAATNGPPNIPAVELQLGSPPMPQRSGNAAVVSPSVQSSSSQADELPLVHHMPMPSLPSVGGHPSASQQIPAISGTWAHSIIPTCDLTAAEYKARQQFEVPDANELSRASAPLRQQLSMPRNTRVTLAPAPRTRVGSAETPGSHSPSRSAQKSVTSHSKEPLSMWDVIVKDLLR